MKFHSKNQIKRKKRLPSSKLPSAKQDNLHLRRSGHYIPPNYRLPYSEKILNYLAIPLLLVEKQVVEPIANLSDKSDLFKILEKISFLIAITVFIVQMSDRNEQRIFEAWQIVKDGRGSKSGVVKLALQRLHNDDFVLSGINAEKTNLKKISLKNAKLSDANFNGANFSGAKLNLAILKSANLTRANLVNAHLWFANLTRANLSRANLTNAVLNGTNLNNADLSNTNLNNADLSNTNLNNADLNNANLTRAKLTSSDLNNADLSGANLEGAIFCDQPWDNSPKNITPVQIKQAKNWDKAIYCSEFIKQLRLLSKEDDL